MRDAPAAPCRRVVGAATILVAGALLWPANGQAQVGRVPVVVDYVAVEGVYLPVGSDRGVMAGDTVEVGLSPAGTGPSLRLAFATVTRRRSVARPLENPWPEVGDTLWLDLSTTVQPASEAPQPDPIAGDASGQSPPRAAATGPSPTAGRRPGPSFAGRLSLEVVGRESTTSWGGDLPGSATRRYATPATRFSLVGSNLPGGLELEVGGRASYRYSSDFTGPPPASVRFYELALTRSFSAFPARITAGRFSNPYERYSGFWDGLMLRIGGRTGLGAGIAAGFEPRRADEAPSTEIPKLTGFVDLALGRSAWRYDTDVSVHLVRPGSGDELRSLGWSQRIGVGRLSVSQRLLIRDAAGGKGPVLQQLRLRAGLDLGGGVSLFGAYGRRAPDLVGRLGEELDPTFVAPTLVTRTELRVGVGLAGAVGSLGLDLGRTELGGTVPGRTLSVRSTLRIGRGGAFASGRVRKATEAETLDVSPGVFLRLGGLDVRTSYRFYRSRNRTGSIETQAADASLRFDPGRGIGVTIGGGSQWGANLSGTFARISLTRSF